jgi:hypothetical protein
MPTDKEPKGPTIFLQSVKIGTCEPVLMQTLDTPTIGGTMQYRDKDADDAAPWQRGRLAQVTSGAGVTVYHVE